MLSWRLSIWHRQLGRTDHWIIVATLLQFAEISLLGSTYFILCFIYIHAIIHIYIFIGNSAWYYGHKNRSVTKFWRHRGKHFECVSHLTAESSSELVDWRHWRLTFVSWRCLVCFCPAFLWKAWCERWFGGHLVMVWPWYFEAGRWQFQSQIISQEEFKTSGAGYVSSSLRRVEGEANRSCLRAFCTVLVFLIHGLQSHIIDTIDISVMKMNPLFGLFWWRDWDRLKSDPPFSEFCERGTACRFLTVAMSRYLQALSLVLEVGVGAKKLFALRGVAPSHSQQLVLPTSEFRLYR